jgi:hypothetical protein
MDPITVIVAAVAAGAATGLTDAASTAVKDAYAGLKRLITDRYSDIDLRPVEKKPDSEGRRLTLREDFEAAGAQDDDDLITAARELIAVVRAQDESVNRIVGIDLADIEAASLNIGKVRSTGDGVRVERGKFAGDVNIENVRAGSRGRRHP